MLEAGHVFYRFPSALRLLFLRFVFPLLSLSSPYLSVAVENLSRLEGAHSKTTVSSAGAVAQSGPTSSADGDTLSFDCCSRS